MEAFSQFSKLPGAVIYTHHPDHAFGAAGWGVTEEQVKSGEVKVIASDHFIPNLVNDVGVTGKPDSTNGLRECLPARRRKRSPSSFWIRSNIHSRPCIFLHAKCISQQ